MTAVFQDAHLDLLLRLLATPTVTPMETGEPSPLAQAQRLYASHAAGLGFEVALHEPAPAAALAAPVVPVAVGERARDMGVARFLESQPNLVLRLGPPRPPAATLMVNMHLDTVGGGPPVERRDGVVRGRGAVDMKGPAVAVLAAVEAALAQRPDLPQRTTVLLQVVGGEEGGAMGVYGTRALVEAGFVGALNVFAEPTRCRFVDSCTASMTAEFSVRGHGSTDDAPADGHNATLLLGHLATELAERLDAPLRAHASRMAIAGLHTGTSHDRVYGSGRLLVNLAYPTAAAGAALQDAVEAAFARALETFAARFADVALARRSAADAARVCSLRWLKKGLPPLANRDPAWERRLRAAGVEPAPDVPEARFTCDAIWGAGAGGFSVVLGPGDLARDGAHTDDEHVELAELDRYSRALARVILEFDRPAPAA
jgi:acetylornithine deacetylase/succinyl-diaminopimelate desuccinylase-like protein